MNLRAAWAIVQIQGQLELHFEFLFPRTNSSGCNAAQLVEHVSTHAQSPGFGPQYRSKLVVVGIKPSLVPCPGIALGVEAEVVQVIHPWLHSASEATLGFMRPSKNKKTSLV